VRGRMVWMGTVLRQVRWWMGQRLHGPAPDWHRLWSGSTDSHSSEN